MQCRKNKTRSSLALTLVEMLVAMSIMAIILAAILPQLRVIQNSWSSRVGASETLQNGRVLIDHLNRNLSKAARITAVSGPSETNGYIEFIDNDANNVRYDIGVNNYVEFGQVGDLYELAGPVSQLLFTCYDGNDFTTPITDVSAIRSVKVETTLINSASLDQDMNFTAQAYLRANTSKLVGWWKLDESSGLTAVDSSVFDNDGTLTNMSGNEWITGPTAGALSFDGIDDHISGIGDCPTGNFTVAGWAKDTGGAGWRVVYSAGVEIWLGVDSGASTIYLHCGGNANGAVTAAGTWIRNTWHHIAATWDGTSIHIYLDGIDMPITIDGTPQDPAAEAAVIGAWSGNPGVEENWTGALDDIRVYAMALTAEEISGITGVTYKQFTEAKAGSDTTSVTISTPSGTSEGDLLIAAVATDENTSVSMAPPGGEDWTEIDVDYYNGEVTLGTWWKLADASESPSHEFTWSGGEQAYAWIMRFTGHDPTEPINVSETDSEYSSTPTNQSVTTTVDGCLILRLGGFDDYDITVDDPGLSGHTPITMDSSGGHIIYEEFTEKKLAAGGTSLTIDTPTGTSEDDLLIAAVVTESDTSGSLAPPGGEGWIEIDIGQQDGRVTLGVWGKLAQASESSTHQFTWGANKQAYGWIMRFTGHLLVSTIDVTAATGGKSTTPESPSVTTTVDNAMIVRIGGFKDGDITVDAPGLSGHTAITMDYNKSGGKCSGGAGYKIQTVFGSSGTSNFSLTKSKEYRAVTIAIAPATVAGGSIVSGGAGYIKQLFIGDSGTSDFVLTASEESRTLTIAIAPEVSFIEAIRP
ncbi:MAG: hypothetical protein GY774_18475 [Planctomycetes bacterium]|nr:hypothetical protein [Planctomycetota bacterium]